MKFVTTILIELISILSISAQNTKQTITVNVVNATSDKGSVKFALYDKETFMIKEPLQSKEGKITKGKTTVVFKNVLSGEYAIVSFHDKNSNGRMDFQSNGMPLEDYGASNNVMNFGSPRYHDAKFTVADKDVSLEIRM